MPIPTPTPMPSFVLEFPSSLDASPVAAGSVAEAAVAVAAAWQLAALSAVRKSCPAVIGICAQYSCVPLKVVETEFVMVMLPFCEER